MKLALTERRRADEAVPLDQPFGVVGCAEFEACFTEFLDRFENAHPEQVFLQRADEAFGATIALWCSDKGGRAFNAENVISFWKWSDIYCEPWS